MKEKNFSPLKKKHNLLLNGLPLNNINKSSDSIEVDPQEILSPRDFNMIG